MADQRAGAERAGQPDPFDLLGLPARFDLSEDEVRSAWLARAAEAHPDHADDPLDPGESAAALNDARRTLADPERRAGALLARLGGPSERDDTSLPPELLMEFMEAREALEEAVGSHDGAAIERSRAWALDRRESHIRAVGAMFDEAHAAGDRDPQRAMTLRAIRVELDAWRYAERMLEQIDRVE